MYVCNAEPTRPSHNLNGNISTFTHVSVSVLIVHLGNAMYSCAVHILSVYHCASVRYHNCMFARCVSSPSLPLNMFTQRCLLKPTNNSNISNNNNNFKYSGHVPNTHCSCM